jgi:Secretory lipase
MATGEQARSHRARTLVIVLTTEESISDTPDVVALKARFLSANPSGAQGWSAHLEDNRPAVVPAAIPLLVSQGLADTLVRPDVTEAFVHQQCTAGASIELDTYPAVGHFAVRTVAAPKVATWLVDRLHGAPAAAGCATTVQG